MISHLTFMFVVQMFDNTEVFMPVYFGAYFLSSTV